MRLLCLTLALLALAARAGASDAPVAPSLTPSEDASAPAGAPPPAVSTAAAPVAEPPPRFSGWHAAGVWGGASLGASFGALTYGFAATVSPHTRTSSCPGSACAIAAFGGMGAGLIAGGVLGYFLGGIAREGRLWARVLTLAFDVLGLPVTATSFFGVVIATGNLPTGGG